MATNTTERSEVDKTTKDLLVDAKIPVPNFAGNPATTGETLPETTLETFNKKRRAQQKRFDAQFEITKTAKLAWIESAETLTAGDPTIAELKKKYETEYLKILSITDELNTLT